MTGRYFQDSASKTVIGCGCTYNLQRGIVALRKKAAALLLDNVISLLFLLVWIMGILRWRRGRREERGRSPVAVRSYAEVVHHPSACAGDVKQDASCLSQFPRFFPISGRRNFRPARFRKRTVPISINLKFATFNEKGNAMRGARGAPQIVVWLVIPSWERKPVDYSHKNLIKRWKKCEIGLRLSCTGRYAPREAWRNPTCGTAPPLKIPTAHRVRTIKNKKKWRKLPLATETFLPRFFPWISFSGE